jgi:hypothetical protein
LKNKNRKSFEKFLARSDLSGKIAIRLQKVKLMYNDPQIQFTPERLLGNGRFNRVAILL